MYITAFIVAETAAGDKKNKKQRTTKVVRCLQVIN